MREVIPGRLWYGNARDARDVRGLLNLGIRAEIDVAIEEQASVLPRDVIYCRFPILDGAGNRGEVIRAAVYTVAEFVRSQVPTLVACGAGMSRSPAIAAAAIARAQGTTLDEGL